GLAVLVVGWGFLSASSARGAGTGTFAVQGVGSDVFDRLADDYRFGLGFNFLGSYEISRVWDLRGDFGVRFLEGEQVSQTRELQAPDLGARYGERTDGLRVMPITVDVVRRMEEWSRNRFWVPYAGAGLGFYDIQARYLPEDPEAGVGMPDEDLVRKDNIFKFGWNAKVGVNLHRTSGLFVNLESGLHMIDTRRRWTPMYDVSLGVGTILPRR
ncbi:MAG: outer membrane beta-barrel protein, partial [Candidatus Eisenbacteria bacterium]|nr:outer membrane beta-barrel protein [Candidatus Eisenbacteria bacterium]